MSHILMGILVSSTLIFGNVTASWPAAAPTASTVQILKVQTTDATKNESPLPSGGAAGIKEAQGLEGTDLIGVLAGIGIGALLLFVDFGDEEASSTTGT
jgi:hypothetical protein